MVFEGYRQKLDVMSVGLGLGLVSSALLFQVGQVQHRMVLSAVMGIGFSPVFTADESGHARFFSMGLVFAVFSLLILAGFRASMAVTMLVLGISSYGEMKRR
jgi:hypothetical protein